MRAPGIPRQMVLIACLVLPAVGLGQQRTLATYPVEPIYPPPLQRPSVEVPKDRLPQGTTGRLPTFDGEFFQMNLRGDERAQATTQGARTLVDRMLQALNWRQEAEALRAVDPVERPLAQDDQLEARIKELSEETRQKQKGTFGEMSQTSEEVLREQAELARRQSQQQTRIFQFDQYHQDTPIDDAYLRLVWRAGRGFSTLQGRVFNEIRVANRRALDPDQATDSARRHVRKNSELSDEPGPPPRPVILPYAAAFRHAWIVTVGTPVGPYEVWVDAESGDILQLLPMFASASATGLVFDPDPDSGTKELSFEVDAASGGQYRLERAGVLEVGNDGADGECSGDLTLSDDGSGSANFNVSPINGTAVDRTSVAGYNCRFQDVNAYAWIYNHITTFNDLLGSVAMPAISATVNHANPCGFGISNACANWGSWSLSFGIGQATISGSTSCNDGFNAALDATVLTHEFGHLVNHRNHTGSVPGHIDEGLADFWAYTMFDTDTFGDYWGQNCATPSQAGWFPRQVESLDVFPEHRDLSTISYADGQIIGWALWNVRREFNEISALGTFLINSNLLDALGVANFGTGTSARDVHDDFLSLLEALVDAFKDSSNIHKVTSGFARAGLFLSPADAVVDIDDDYLNRGDAAGPTFTVWTGRDYTFNADESVNTGSQPFNTRFEIELANDSGFTVNLTSSGVLGGVVAAEGGTATWTLPVADWNTLKVQDHIYYRVITTNDTGGNTRRSEDPGNGFLENVPPAFAVVNESGDCECACGASAKTPRSAALVTLLPILVGLGRMVGLKRTKT